MVSRLLCASWFQLNICTIFFLSGVWFLLSTILAVKRVEGGEKEEQGRKNKEEILVSCITYHFFFSFHILMFALVGSYIGRRDTVHG